MTSQPVMMWCPFADEDSAARAADILLDENLICCANILAPMRSMYRWGGERGESSETGALFKTNSESRDRAIARLAAIHPYDEPAILAWLCDAPGETTEWLAKMGA